MSITFSKFGNYGRLGNQLFQYASIIGISKFYGTDVVLPKCDFAEYLLTPPTIGELPNATPVNEQHFHYDMGQFANAAHHDINITGWLQSEKYWAHCRKDVEFMLFPNANALWSVFVKYESLFDKPTIAISIRRGDYVNNPNYELLNADYYYLALLEHFPGWRDYNILIFSDDIPYCKVHFQCLPNVYFVDGLTPMEQLMLGSMCDHFIIANSTFSWWMAYFGEKNNSKVIRPAYLFDGELKRTHDDKDFWPERWVKFDHKGKRLNMRDVTFLIPFTEDSNDRLENMQAITKQHMRHFDSQVYSGSPINQNGKFHRTQWLNSATNESTTPIVINYDCDILTPPLQLYLAVEMLRRGEADMVYPYDGRFARVPRTWLPTVQKYNDVGMFRGTEFKGCRETDAPSVGGVVAYRKDKFIESGGENEKMVSYGSEDVERYRRWLILGYKVARIKGCVYHLDHVITVNSSTQHEDFKANEIESKKVQRMNKDELREYVDKWRYFDK